MPKNKCCGCKERFERDVMIKLPGGLFHTIECASDYAYQRQVKAKVNKELKTSRERHRADKRKIRKRTGTGGYYDSLKIALHRYVKHVLRKGEPCYTCGKPQSSTDSGSAFHVGHNMPAKQVDPRRFMLENLRMQCYSCNAMNSGRRVEYRAAMIKEMGLEHVEWLECVTNHPELKEQYPDVEDIEKAAAYYRKLYRDAEKQALIN